MQERMGDKDLDKLLEEAIDDGLNVLGKSGKQMLYFHLENNYSVKKHEIAQKPEDFTEAIQEIFGAGASVLEKLILKSVYSKLGLKYKETTRCKLSDCLKKITIALEQRSRDSSKTRVELDENFQLTC